MQQSRGIPQSVRGIFEFQKPAAIRQLDCHIRNPLTPVSRQFGNRSSHNFYPRPSSLSLQLFIQKGKIPVQHSRTDLSRRKNRGSDPQAVPRPGRYTNYQEMQSSASLPSSGDTRITNILKFKFKQIHTFRPVWT